LPVAAQEVRAPSKGLAKAPDTYLDLHGALYRIDSAEWSAAVAQLKTSGDLFTLHVIDELPREGLSGDKKDALKALAAAIRETHAAESLDGGEALRLLEIAAYADVTCHAVEYPLRKWTLAHVARFVGTPDVRAELEQIKSSYGPAFRHELLDTSAPMQSRVREYARSLVKTPPVK
jgi:hypothetical protein